MIGVDSNIAVTVYSSKLENVHVSSICWSAAAANITAKAQ